MNQEVIEDGKFSYLQDWPEEVLPVVRKALSDCVWLVPAWCHDVCVTWNPMVNDRAADMESEFQYRRARLRICAQFLDQTEEERLNVLRHELIHISTSPMVDYAVEAFKKLLDGDEEKPLFKILRDGLSERHEGCVEDLTRCIQSRKNN